ncbi:MAG: DMT family transporter [Pseudomonadota bacterium]
MKNTYIYISVAISALLFGAATPLSKLLLDEMHPVMLAALFYFGASLAMLPFSLPKLKAEWRVLKTDRKDALYISGSIIFGGFLAPLALLFGIKMMYAGSASLLLTLETVTTSFFAWFFFKEHISKRMILSSILCITASIILLFQGNFQVNFGAILVIAATIFWGLDNNFTASIAGISSSTTTFLKSLFGGLLNLLLVWSIASLDAQFFNVILALLVGAFAYGVSIKLYIHSARILGAARSQIIFAINPFFGVILSFLIFSDPVGIRFLAALLLMIISVILLYGERHAHYHFHEETEHVHDHTHLDDHHTHEHRSISKDDKHSHPHKHSKILHEHPHMPDIHHRHGHED